ncbi:putative RNA-directed DNA polymerase [Tanacetum coccineum]
MSMSVQKSQVHKVGPSYKLGKNEIFALVDDLKVKLQNANIARKLKEEFRKWHSRFKFGFTGTHIATWPTTWKMRVPTGIGNPMIVLCMVSVDVDVDLVATGRSYRCTDLGGMMFLHEFSDHTPLLLSNFITDYGPTPFKLYNSWISHIDFRPLVLRCWGPYVVHSTVHPAVSFKSKLQHLKSSIKKWRSDIQGVESAATAKLRGKLDALDNKAEVGPLTPTDATAGIDIVRELTSLERTKVMDLREKAKVRWAIDGDENSHFFHGMLNSKLNHSRINGLNILGSWITNPVLIKNHIYQFYESKFKETSNRRPSFTSNLFKHISVEDSNLLDCTITPQEIKDAIWDCGGDKAPGPDGFTFKFFKKHWEFIKDDIIAYVKEFDNTAYIPRGCNSSFITLIPKIDDPLTIGEFRPISLIGCQYKIIAKILANRLSLFIPSVIGEVQMAYIKGRQIIDGPLIVDEIISWAKKYKKHLMFLKSAFASVLINGSPTKEFKVEKGLRQGDLLSPFLFIIAIEALNVALLNACNNNAFHRVKVGKDNIHVSHLQFAVDALVMGEWSWLNAMNYLGS